ncbi:MAG TPA: hypothetical protein VFQ15_07495 [Jiangellaceae bacterium]|nr:hypothetical protein [Jiangellaceae bacterium]
MSEPIAPDQLAIGPAKEASWEDLAANFGTTEPRPVPVPEFKSHPVARPCQ